MPRTAFALGLIVAAAALPAAAQQPRPACPVGPNDIIAASTSTSRVHRMGAGSDLLTQHATIRNPSATALSITVELNHRAFQSNFVAGMAHSIAAGGQIALTLGNVVKPGLTVDQLRSTTVLRCAAG
jgi:hypothetical protein